MRAVLTILLLAFLAPQDKETVLNACWGTAPEEIDPAKVASLQDARYA